MIIVQSLLTRSFEPRVQASGNFLQAFIAVLKILKEPRPRKITLIVQRKEAARSKIITQPIARGYCFSKVTVTVSKRLLNISEYCKNILLQCTCITVTQVGIYQETKNHSNLPSPHGTIQKFKHAQTNVRSSDMTATQSSLQRPYMEK